MPTLSQAVKSIKKIPVTERFQNKIITNIIGFVVPFFGTAKIKIEDGKIRLVLTRSDEECQ